MAHHDFDETCVYVYVQEKACDALKEAIETLHPQNCQFFIEGFH